MGFPRRLLVDGETLVLTLRPHWVVLVWPSVVTLAVLGVWALLLPRLPASANQLPQWATVLVGLGVLAAVVWAAPTAVGVVVVVAVLLHPLQKKRPSSTSFSPVSARTRLASSRLSVAAQAWA